MFNVLWVATLVSNVGTWMQNASAGWLMTSLDPDPLIVSLIQVATALPMFLFSLPAGALSDILDRRKLLIAVQATVAIVAAFLALIVELDRVTPVILLTFTFLVGAGAALVGPSWQAIVPQLVPRAHLTAAITMNGAGFNVSRAIGPALAGVIIGVFGLATPFWLNAASFIGVILALMWWKPSERLIPDLPAERFWSALKVGMRHARGNSHLQSTAVRGAGFFLFASAYWALLPLLARNQIVGGPGLYGSLLGTIGAGAVAGAFILPYASARLGPDRLVAAGTAGTVLALVAFALVREPVGAFLACIVAGVSWIFALAQLNVSAQVALPSWVRGRGLSLFAMIQFGAMAGGSVVWGKAASVASLPWACLAAAAGAALTIPLLSRWKVQTGAELDMTPSRHWATPVVSGELQRELDGDHGPILTTIEYQISRNDRQEFLHAIELLSRQRKRDGAYAWGLFEDMAEPQQYLEYFLTESWFEHLRMHERVTEADREIQERARSFHRGELPPKVRHYLVPGRNPAELAPRFHVDEGFD